MDELLSKVAKMTKGTVKTEGDAQYAEVIRNGIIYRVKLNHPFDNDLHVTQGVREVIRCKTAGQVSHFFSNI